MNKIYNLSNRVALITGAGGFLGLFHAKALLENGATVIITDRNISKLNKNFFLLKNDFKNNQIYKAKIDVTSEKDLFNFLKIIKKKFKKLDILINNAAIDSKVNTKGNLKKNNKFEYFSIEQWNKELSVGLTGYFLCSKIFGSYMAENKKGVILNISSDLSVIAPDQRLYAGKQKKPVTYSVIKTGIIGLTKYLASYWGHLGVRVNSLSPGGIYNNQDTKFVKRISTLIPLNRMLEKEELKGSIQFLCSDASSYLNGHNLVLDGGRSII